MEGAINFFHDVINYHSEKIDEHNARLLFEKDLVHNGWTINKEMKLYFHTTIYKYDYNAFFQFEMQDRNNLARSFEIYARYNSKTWEEAVMDLEKRSEFNFPDWEEYDKESDRLITLIKDRQSKLGRYHSLKYNIKGYLNEVSALHEYSEQYAIHMNIHLHVPYHE